MLCILDAPLNVNGRKNGQGNSFINAQFILKFYQIIYVRKAPSVLQKSPTASIWTKIISTSFHWYLGYLTTVLPVQILHSMMCLTISILLF